VQAMATAAVAARMALVKTFFFILNKPFYEIPSEYIIPTGNTLDSNLLPLDQKLVPIWNWKRCTSSPFFLFSGKASENFRGPRGEIHATPTPTE